MAKSGYIVNTNRIQKDVYFTSGNTQGKYNKRNPWIELFQNQKLDFQSILIVLSHLPF